MASFGSGFVNSAQILDGAITTAKLADGAVTNTKTNASAAIAYSKLNLGTSIVNADISTSAAIATSKILNPGWVEVATAEVSGGAVANITFSGLTGNTTRQYMLQGYILSNAAGGTSLLIQPNADATAGNYTRRNEQPGGATGATAGCHLGVAAGSGTISFTAFVIADLTAANGRVMWGLSNGDSTSHDNDTINWNNTAAEITSIACVIDSGAANINNGSYITLFARG